MRTITFMSGSEHPADWNIRRVPWLKPGSVVPFDGEDLARGSMVQLGMRIGPMLGKGGQAAVFDVRANVGSDVSWVGDDVVLRVSYRDDEYGRDPRRTSIYRRLAAIRCEASGGLDPLAGLLELHAVGNLPPLPNVPKADLWAQVLARGGVTLSAWVDGGASGPLGAHGGVEALLPMARALARCHAEGIAHRDIKPGNVFVSERSAAAAVAWLGDLGSMSSFSRETDFPDGDGDEAFAAPDAMGHDITTNIDTGPFTPPEVRGLPQRSPASPAGDIWQYAVTLHYACAGDLPFLGWRSRDWTTNSARYIEACRAGEPNSPAFAGLPDRLQYMLRWCLAADPHDRPRASDLVEALEDFHPEATDLYPPAVPAKAWASGSPLALPAQPVKDLAAYAPRADGTPDAGETTTAREADVPQHEGGEVGWRPGWTRLALAALGAVAASVLLVVLIHESVVNGDGTAAPAPAQTQVTSPAPEATEIPPFSGGSLIIRREGPDLQDRLPQLVAGTQLGDRPVLGTLATESWEYCTTCVDRLVRLRATVAIDEMYAEQELNEGVPGDRLEGPYVVVVTDTAAQVPQPPLTQRKVHKYPMPSQYATPGEFDTVYLVPSNPSGFGQGESAGDTSWQTKLRNQSDGPSTLVFDIPHSMHFATVLWFTPDGVVGFNQFTGSANTTATRAPEAPPPS